MAIRTRQAKNKRDSNGVLTGRPGTVYDVDIKYTAPDGTKKSYTKREAAQHEAEMKTKLQNPGQIASITSQCKQTVAAYAAYPFSRFAPYSGYEYAPTDRRLLYRGRSFGTYACGH